MKRFWIMLGTLVLLTVSMGEMSSFAHASAQVSGDTQAQQDISVDYTGRSNSFYAYLKELENSPYAEAGILFYAEQAILSDENAKLVEEDGKKGVRLSENGWMEWTFHAEKTAIYQLKLEYKTVKGKNRKPQVSIQLDGAFPYNELEGYELNRIFRNETEIQQDEKGNDLIPNQQEVYCWQTLRLLDTSGFTGQYLCLMITEGQHTLRLSCGQEDIIINTLALAKQQLILTDEQAFEKYHKEGYSEIKSFQKIVQAETATEKSESNLYPMYDRTSPVTVPYHPTRIRRNTIGKENWSKNGMWISFTIDDIPQDGLYYFTIKYRQSYALGVQTYRTIFVNGEVPSASYRNVPFDYGIQWKNKTVTDGEGKACPMFLKKGTNQIRLEVSLGPYVQVLQMVDESLAVLNALYTKMVMITGTNPDPYRDYYLDKEIPGLLESFQTEAENLHQTADLFDQISGEKSNESETIRSMARRLDSLVKNPRTIHTRIASFRNGISSLSSWLNDMTDQPLEMDYFIIHSADSPLPSPKASLWARIKHSVQVFLASFYEDYSAMDSISGKQGAIEVWADVSRDQIQLIKNLILEEFTPKTGIDVSLSLVKSGFIEATLAGQGPDVALGVARGQPVNLASRGALLDFDAYPGLEDMRSRFSETAMVPYEFEGKTYGIPCTQRFYMLFYRKDILSQLGIGVPQTWEDVYKAVPKLQRSHMTIGLPYSIISAATAVDNGLGAKDLFATLVLQNGGSFYTDGYTETRLDSEEAVSAFIAWCDFYTKYGFDLAYDFYTRFTTGEMPIGIASYEMYKTLYVGANEIHGLWGMAPIPGMRREDGTVNNAEAGAGTAAIVFAKTKNPQACYRFVDWWTSNEIQNSFCENLESLLGPGGRYETANLYAFSRQPWTNEELDMLTQQRDNVIELPEIPGSYYVSRSIDNAFRAVLYDNKNPREVFEKENRNINREITRKRKELGLPT